MQVRIPHRLMNFKCYSFTVSLESLLDVEYSDEETNTQSKTFVQQPGIGFLFSSNAKINPGDAKATGNGYCLLHKLLYYIYIQNIIIKQCVIAFFVCKVQQLLIDPLATSMNLSMILMRLKTV